MSKDPELKPAGDAAPKKKGKMGLIIGVLVGVLVLGGGGAAAYFLKFKQPPPAAEGGEGEHGAAPSKEKEKAATGVVAFEPFLVNLAGGNGSTYLRTTLNLLVANELEAKELGESAVGKAKIRSAVIEVLSQQTGETLVTPEGKEELKKALLKAIKGLKQKEEVHDVLFAEFVVQF